MKKLGGKWVIDFFWGVIFSQILFNNSKGILCFFFKTEYVFVTYNWQPI